MITLGIHKQGRHRDGLLVGVNPRTRALTPITSGLGCRSWLMDGHSAPVLYG